MTSQQELAENPYVNVYKGDKNRMYENWMIESEQEPENEYDNSKLKNIPFQNIYDNWKIKRNIHNNHNTDNEYNKDNTNTMGDYVRCPQYYEYWTFTSSPNTIIPITKGVDLNGNIEFSNDSSKNTAGLIKVKVKKYKQCNIM